MGFMETSVAGVMSSRLLFGRILHKIGTAFDTCTYLALCCFNLYCGGFILFCKVWVCVWVCACVGFVIYGCFGNMYTVL